MFSLTSSDFIELERGTLAIYTLFTTVGTGFEYAFRVVLVTKVLSWDMGHRLKTQEQRNKLIFLILSFLAPHRYKIEGRPWTLYHYKQKQPPKVICIKGILKNLAKFTGKRLCQSLF